MHTWYIYAVVPLFAAAIGWFTKLAAVEMLFRPLEFKGIPPYLGWQGLFHTRRDQVAMDYGTLIADEILTPDNIIRAMLTGPQSDRLFSLIDYEVQAVLDGQLGRAKPFVEFAFGPSLDAVKRDLLRTLRARLPEGTAQLERYTNQALDVSALIVEQMRLMTNEEYEGLLRPAFKQDEWKIVTVGAILGFLVGELQVHLLLQ